MQVGKSIGEFDFLSVERHGAIGKLARATNLCGQIITVHRKKPAHAGPFELEHAGHPPGRMEMHFGVLGVAEHPEQEIEKMHADVHRGTARLGRVALPGHVIPGAPPGDVGQADVGPRTRSGRPHCLAQVLERLDQSQLQHRVNAAAVFCLEIRQGVEIPGAQD